MKMRAAIAATLAGQRDERAIQFAGHWWRWGDIADLGTAIEAALAKAGIAADAPVACLLRNRPDQAAVMIHAVAAGRCLVTLNALTPDARLAEEIAEARTPVVMAAPEDWDRAAVREATARLGAVGIAVALGQQPAAWQVPGLEQPRTGANHLPAQPDTTILMLTSGTTGTPKRVPLQTAVLERQLAEGGARKRLPDGVDKSAEKVGIMSGNIVHIGGVWGVLGPAMAGRPICMLEKFTVEGWRAAVVEHRPLLSGGPPAALRMILDADLPPADLASIKAMNAGTAAVDPDLVDAFMDRYGIPVLTNYGATEFAGGVASWSMPAFEKYWQAKRGAVGRVHQSMEARVVDPDCGAELPFGSEGLLELRGFAAGNGTDWVRTTDRAVLDADRFLWIRGRADNAINRGGFKLLPDEVVKVLESHPAVREAAVVGIPDARLGEVPVALVIPRAGVDAPDPEALRTWVRDRMNPYCVPVALRVVDDLPRTPSMKVSTPGVRALFMQATGMTADNRA